MELSAEVKTFLSETADTLHGSARRLFLARAVRDLGRGGQRLAERDLGWCRGTVHKLNLLGYTLTRVAKTQPQKKVPTPTPSSRR